ncbi:MAG: hypothetical protein LBO66_12290 [Deltaproteobacteria bacterium]|jgi:hypothetical protein|nr:hypothetical protein [Deltaproteobacteria bacterium]
MPALLVIGVLIIIGGLTLFVVWIEYLWILIKALAPLALVSLGAIVAYFGWEEKKDRKGAFLDFSSPTEASRYQAEALAFKERMTVLEDSSLASDPKEDPPRDLPDSSAPEPEAPEVGPGEPTPAPEEGQ